MNTKVKINRLATGVPGLDDILGGGLPEFSFNLIAGQPGCGKTTLAHQIMFSLATDEHPALYLTVLGEPPLKMLRYQQQFDFFRSDAINDAVRFVNLSDETLTGNLDQVLARIVEEVQEFNPTLVFIDSFRSVVLSNTPATTTQNQLQQFVQQLGILMTSWQATTFLIGEYYADTDANPVFTVADGLIWLHQSVQRNSMVRKIEVMKMRGQSTLPGLHSFRIDGSGVEVFAPICESPRAKPDDALLAARPRVQMGIPHLDDMLGGGMPAGFSVLVAGPSGSGKSVLASAFLAEGARLGETSVLAVFEQHPNRHRTPMITQLIAEGRIGLVDNRAPDLSIDEIVLLILREIRRLNATRVVIDSLSGFEMCVAPTYREDFRESMLRLGNTLSSAGVTVLMTSELEDRYNDLRFSPYGTAFLTDAIIVQRYIEIDSQLRRVMAVVKVRASDHSNQLREYSIESDGIHIGDMVPGHDGLLGGRPTRKEHVGSSRLEDTGHESSD